MHIHVYMHRCRDREWEREQNEAQDDYSLAIRMSEREMASVSPAAAKMRLSERMDEADDRCQYLYFLY